MKKVLIISYFFPPSIFAGSYRIASWAKYLNKFGFYPIIITRNWDKDILDYQDMSKPTSSEVKHIVTDEYEVYYLPFKGNHKDKLLCKYGEEKKKTYRRFLTFFELIIQLYSNTVIPFKNLYEFSREYIINNQDVKLIITSGKPFILFKFGYLLNKELHIKWIADYRDEWCSSQWNKTLPFIKKVIIFFESFKEKKWVRTASCITSVSELWADNISKYINRPGFVIMNGYDEDDYKFDIEPKLFKEFTITYNGTLYYTQPHDVFLNAFKKVVDRYRDVIKIRLYFPGLLIDKEKTVQVKKSLLGYEDNYIITSRVRKDKVIEIQKKSHVLLMVGHTGIKGTHSSKIFEYLACEKPVILCPTDNDVLEELINETNTGYVCNDSLDAERILNNLIDEFVSTSVIKHDFNINSIRSYSRKFQTEKFSNLIELLYDNKRLIQAENNKNIVCVNCESKLLKEISRFKLAKLLKCKNCDFVFSELLPTKEELDKCYYYYGDDNYYSPITEKRYNEILDSLESYRKTNYLLDYGCGEGLFLSIAKQRGWKVFGIEYSETHITNCLNRGIKVYNPDEFKKPLSKISFDIITSFEVIEHIQNPHEFTNNIHDLLRKGGVTYITTPNFNSVSKLILGKTWSVVQFPEHLAYFTPKTFNNIFFQTGFKKLSLSTTGVSITRFRRSKKNLIDYKVEINSEDEKLRRFIEKSRFSLLLKKAVNFTLTLIGIGDTIKAYYEKE